MLILPAIDILKGKCVRLFQGDYNQETVYGDSPADMAVKWRNQGAKFLHLVDLDGAKAGYPVNIEHIREICSSIDIPCEIGGGIRTQNDVENLFKAGVNRVILGTAACEDYGFIESLIKLYGAEKIVVGIDARNGYVSVKGWLEDSKLEAVELASILSGLGVTRFIYTDISRDGALIGPNYDAVKEFCKSVPNSNVIASGGVGSSAHISELKLLLAEACKNIEGVIVGKALYDGRVSLKEINEI